MSLVGRLRAERLVNTVTQAPWLSGLAERAAGVAPGRTLPAFAPQTFRDWFTVSAAPADTGKPPVLLWPDTFNDHFHPETLRAADEVLETAGLRVTVPRAPVRCGRALYDFGLLRQARRHLEHVIDILGEEIRKGAPVVALEPGCLSVFRDELVNLLPHSEHARCVKVQTHTLAEFLEREPGRLPSYRLEQRLGVERDVLDSGCCGMAGAFGFEARHFDVSIAIGERVLLPAVRAAAADALIIADGFSCRGQIAQGSGRRALRLAEALQMAIAHGPRGPSGDLPERQQRVDHAASCLTSSELAGAALTAAGPALAWTMVRARLKAR